MCVFLSIENKKNEKRFFYWENVYADIVWTLLYGLTTRN